MSKIFRIYKEGPKTYSDWNESPVYPYNSANRDTIEDPDGAKAIHEITSIPSPFARIDLVKNAFKEVCKIPQKSKEPDLDGNTIFHKMVSDALDVGEIFFNIDKFKEQVEIITWDPSNMLDELKNSENAGHQYLANALEKYMISDEKTYNFGKLKNIYLLNYKSGPDPLNIIGATSPATLFFSSANDLSYISDIYFGDDKPFDNDFQPLYKRDFEYIKMWFTLSKVIDNFAELFPEIQDYLNFTYRRITDYDKKQQLNSIKSTSVDQFSPIRVAEEQRTNDVEVLGYNLYKKSTDCTSLDSDFTIATQIVKSEILPLVLPVEYGNQYEKLKYTTALWGKSNVAPYFDNKEIDKRTLPCDGLTASYLTISDFLEDYIIRVPHKLNTEGYYSGNIIIDEPKLSYLLPIKPLFFKYFSVEDLMDTLPDGNCMFEMQSTIGGGVRVFLRIPIRGNGKVNYIEYSRVYYGGDNLANLTENKGGIKTFDFTGLIMPLVKFNNGQDAYYTVSCVSTFSRNYSFSFFINDQKIQVSSESCRNTDYPEVYKSENYTIEQSNFDYIQVKKDKSNVSAIILPKFKKQFGTDIFEFAIDLGTSNTHIEYKKLGDTISNIFGFEKKESLVCQMFVPSYVNGFQDDLDREQQLIQKDFITEEVGNNEFRFPTRTVLSRARNIDWIKVVKPFELVNIPLTYDKRIDLPYNKLEDDVKWGKGNDASIIEAYVNCLMLMLRNKVLTAGGNLGKTKIIWFYPISMSPRRLQLIKKTWDNAYNKYFGGNATVVMTESSAPIQYYFERYSTATNLINVDIGGGTTDVAFAKDKNIEFVTSFKFASNALFENSFSKSDLTNGIVDFYKQEIFKILQEKELKDLLDIYKSENNKKPSNMASFLFSLGENSILREKGVDPKNLDFNYILQDDEFFKIVFVIFYVSIIYHVAEIVKKKHLVAPRHIAFSGNGSKIIKVITTDLKLLANFTKVIFEYVLEEPYPGNLEILGLETNSNPKESTCKGGLVADTYENDDRNKIIINKVFGNGFISIEDTYEDIDDNYLNNTISAIRKFFDFVLIDLNKKFNYQDNFGVTSKSLELAKDICYNDWKAFIEKGISERMEEGQGNNKIEETLFFYPLRGVLNILANEIYKSLNNNKIQ